MDLCMRPKHALVAQAHPVGRNLVTPFSARMDLATRSDAYAGAMHASSVPSCIFNVSFPVWRLR